MTLAHDFDLSRRQAYRYVRQAQGLECPVPVAEPPVPITLKIPGNVARELRAYAASHGLALGEIVTRALAAFLARAPDHG